MCVDLTLFPLDTIKTRLQSQQGFYKAGGFRGIYAGVPSAAVGSFPNGKAPSLEDAVRGGGGSQATAVHDCALVMHPAVGDDALETEHTRPAQIKMFYVMFECFWCL